MPPKTGRKRTKSKESAQSAHEDKPQYAFTLLSAELSREIVDSDFSTIESVVCKLLGFDADDIAVSLKLAAIVNYYTSALWFAKDEMRFTEWQLSTFYTLMHTMLKNLQEQGASIVQNCVVLRTILTQSTLDEQQKSERPTSQEKEQRTREPVDSDLPREGFTLEQSKAIADYVFATLFQHYSLYVLLFTHEQPLIQLDENKTVEVAPLASLPWPPPLCEGVSDEMYSKYLAPKAASQRQQSGVHAVSGGKDDAAASQATATELTLDRLSIDKEDRLERLLATTPLDTVKKVIEDCCNEVLRGVEADVLNGLRDRENSFINRINKIHFVAASTPDSVQHV